MPWLSLITPSSLLADKPLGPLAKYHRLRRLLSKLSKLRLIRLEKLDGLLVAFPTTAAFDLITRKQTSNTQTDPRRLRRPAPERQEALQILDSIIRFEGPARDAVINLFISYLDRVKKSRLILKPITADAAIDVLERDETRSVLVLPYSTRFTDPRRLRRNLAIYNAAWRRAERLGYQTAVHVTLTTDPKRFRSLKQATDHLRLALNRFFSWIALVLANPDSYRRPKRRKPPTRGKQTSLSKFLNPPVRRRPRRRPPHIVSYEFTSKEGINPKTGERHFPGLPHAHIVLFGTSWLALKDFISREWSKIGQGVIVDVYAIKYSRGRWIYAKKKPSDAPSRDAKSYLRKYLSKTLSALQPDETGELELNYPSLFFLSLYWALGVRFHTYSPKLRPPSGGKPPYPRFALVGVVSAENEAELDEQIAQLLARFYLRAPWWAAVDRGPPFI